MKQLFKFLLFVTLLFVIGCSKEYDDSALSGRVDDLENRVAKLEQLCNQLNTNITSLQTIVTSLQTNDYVTGVTPISENGSIIGYTITFVKSQPVTIYHGKDGTNGTNGTNGKDGYTPIIGVKQYTDGVYYWTLDGDWLLGDDGNKIKAQGIDGEDGAEGANGNDGTDGKDGITPHLKIEDGYWSISYDKGQTWTQLGKATGEDGKDGYAGANGTDGKDGDLFFQSVDTSNGEYVLFTLFDGTTIKLPTWSANNNKKSISILFVGNSLTQDGIAYLPYMLKTYYPEVDFKIYMWYIGGKTLGDHYSSFTNSGKADIFSVAENSASWTNNSKNTTMASVLSKYKFDIVCMQEYFNYKTSYEDCTDWNNCRNYIRTNYKGGNALEFISLFHAPLRKDGYDVHEVYKRTEEGNALILKSTISEDIIPNGIAVYRALDTDLNSLGDLGQLSSDGTHTQEGLPCLLQTYVTLCWLFDRLGINKSIYGHPMRMTTAIYKTINAPGANLGRGVIQGTDAQNLLAQEIAIKAYKEGKQFLYRNLYSIEWGGGTSYYASPRYD